MALANGGILYLSNTEHGKIYAFDLNHQGRYRVLEPTPMPKHWQPATLAVDYQGTLYATDAGTNTVAQIGPNGHIRVVATATAGKIRSAPPVVIIQAPNSFTLTNDIYASIHNGQALLLLQIDASPASGLNGLAAQIGDTFYEVTSEGPLAASLTDGSAATIGGNDAATQHCEMTR
jgi:DNA-binding beta-propeller fold protein YncE